MKPERWNSIDFEEGCRDLKKKKISDEVITAGLRVVLRWRQMGSYLLCSPTASCKSSPNHPVVFLKRVIISNRTEFCHWSSSTSLGWPSGRAPMALHCSGLIQGDSSCLGEGRFTNLFTSDCLPWSWRTEILLYTQFFRSKIHQPVACRWNGSLEEKVPDC